MPLTVTVTRGYTFVPGVPFGASDLNAAALPNIAIVGSVGTSEIEAGAVTAPKVTPGPYAYAAASGGPTAYVASLNPGPASLVAGLAIRLAISTANTGPVTLNVNSLGVREVRKWDRQPLVAGDLAASTIHELVFDGTYWLLQTEAGSPRRFFPTSTGTGAAYEVLLMGYGFNAYADIAGYQFAFVAHASSTGPATLNVNGKGPVALRRHDGTVMEAGNIQLGQPVVVMFDGSVFRATNVIAISAPPSASIEAVVAEANGTATALGTNTIVATATATLPAGKTWKLVRVTFSSWMLDIGIEKGMENFRLHNDGTLVSAPNTARGLFHTENSDNSQVMVVWEWVPSGGDESADLDIDILADLGGGWVNGDEPGSRKIVISGLCQ